MNPYPLPRPASPAKGTAATSSRPMRFSPGKWVSLPFRGMAIWLVLTSFSPPAGAEPQPVIDHDGLSAAILAETNRERVARGLHPLKQDMRLVRAADGHTKFLVLAGGQSKGSGRCLLIVG